MYLKLAMRNMVRSAKNYLIYFITVSLTVALMYSFVALGLSEDIISLSENMVMLTTCISVLSVFVALAASFVISYAVRFMLEQRKKEFATYELLGMEVGTIQKLFLLENCLIGVLAFGIGIVIGAVLSGVFSQIVANIFKVPREYKVTCSISALMLVFIFFLLMYGVGIFRAVRIIRRAKIINLLYDSHKNEQIPDKKIAGRILVVGFSFAVIAGSMFGIWKGFSIQTNAAWLVFIAAVCGLFFGVYGIYYNIPYLLLTFARNRVTIKYTNDNLFYFGQITRRIQSGGRMMAVTAILFTISLATMFVGLTMGNSYRANIEVEYPYDVGVAIDAPLTQDSFLPLVSYVNESASVLDSRVFYLYTLENYNIVAMSYSDYSYLRSLLGLQEVSLQSGEYLVHCDTWNYQKKIMEALSSQNEIALAGSILVNPQSTLYTEPMEQYQIAGINGYVLVVPDDVASLLIPDKIRIVMELENDGYPELRGEIRRFLNGDEWNPKMQQDGAFSDRITMSVTVKAWGIANSLTGFTTISFCGFYLSLVFILLSSTILAFKQLSAMEYNRRNYGIIDKMGVSKKTQGHLMHRELGTFFLIPLVMPVIVLVLLIVGAQNMFGAFILQDNIIPISGMITFAVFGVIYVVYYQATYYLFKRTVMTIR